MGEPHRRSRGLDCGDPIRKTCQHLEHPAAAGAGEGGTGLVWGAPKQLPAAVTATPGRQGCDSPARTRGKRCRGDSGGTGTAARAPLGDGKVALSQLPAVYRVLGDSWGTAWLVAVGTSTKGSGGSGISFYRKDAVIDAPLLRSPPGGFGVGAEISEDGAGSCHSTQARFLLGEQCPNTELCLSHRARFGVLGFPREPDAGPVPTPITADPSQR